MNHKAHPPAVGQSDDTTEMEAFPDETTVLVATALGLLQMYGGPHPVEHHEGTIIVTLPSPQLRIDLVNKTWYLMHHAAILPLDWMGPGDDALYAEVLELASATIEPETALGYLEDLYQDRVDHVVDRPS